MEHLRFKILCSISYTLKILKHKYPLLYFDRLYHCHHVVKVWWPWGTISPCLHVKLTITYLRTSILFLSRFLNSSVRSLSWWSFETGSKSKLNSSSSVDLVDVWVFSSLTSRFKSLMSDWIADSILMMSALSKYGMEAY